MSDRETLFFSARVLLETVANREPIVLLFEDIHWADPSLLDLLETLAVATARRPVLLLALTRPELLTERPGWGGGLPAYTALPLEPLPSDAPTSSRERLLERRGARRSDACGAVAKTAEGNPLFIEELAAALAERTTDDADELPTSIRAIVSARLDALPADERTLAPRRRRRRPRLLEGRARADRGGPRPDALLGSLEQRDLVRREAVSRIQGDQQFAFKHGLIQDVAYQILPRAGRRERHAQVAAFLEDTTGEVGQSNEALAHHWREAGEPRRAVDCLIVAADQAGRGWAKAHAVTLYRAALALVPPDDERHAEIRRQLAVALMAEYHVDDAERLRPAHNPAPRNAATAAKRAAQGFRANSPPSPGPR